MGPCLCSSAFGPAYPAESEFSFPGWGGTASFSTGPLMRSLPVRRTILEDGHAACYQIGFNCADQLTTPANSSALLGPHGVVYPALGSVSSA
jgi:hypothetical protein